ncbi:hypothetical protein NECAME_06461 [Necator americanus]|uniref:Uncharacterized protein n=1 Tax=Necator americanus TaxID=51031 RepID=W2TW68_NECAM|nr:hypothetical protein NECAME_06461 [Necator americanus]ETN85301.1 hypothetical protein NECAME_06461 [Necator americanus]
MIRAVSACFPVASLPPLSFCLFQSADCDRKRVVSLASRAHKRLASTHPAPIFSDPHSSTPAAQPIMDMLYSVCFKNRERVEEERWTRGRPIGSTSSFAPYCLQHLEDAHPVAHPVAHPAVHESTQLISSARSTSEVKIECKF